jgi:hypothetical protein
MARVKVTKELKAAIEELSVKEILKLFYRLLPSNDVLVEKLEFELLEQRETLGERKNDIIEEIQRRADIYPKYYSSPRNLASDIRSLSGLINRYYKVTSDKIGEIELHLNLLVLMLTPNLAYLKKEHEYAMDKLTKYVVARIKKIGLLLSKVHDDFRLEFESELDALKNIISELILIEEEAAKLGVDVSFKQ